MQATAHTLEQVFNAVFAASHNTILVGGAAEPFYRPADDEHPQHRIFYREDYAASCLHEIAHWLVAGPARQLLPDWGYWYAPDGRSAEQQRVFESVEIKPQALEWLLNLACGLHFRVSADNLSGEVGDLTAFKDAVYQQACRYARDGLSPRAQQVCEVFARAFAGVARADEGLLQREALD